MNKIYRTPTEAFEAMYSYIMHYGTDFAGTKAVFNHSFNIVLPEHSVISTPKRKFNKEYADYEFDWYMTGNRDASKISERAKMWKNMMIPGTTEVISNYGYFWNKNRQLEKMIKELKKNKQTRRAVLIHYDLEEIDLYQYDTPCNLALNFYVREDLLQLSVFARSIDLWYGWCNDQYCFQRLMKYVSENTGYDCGSMHWHITNLHLYERHWLKM
jgi:thymidylate synthase